MSARLLAVLLFLFAATASAHRLDEYLQAARVAVASDRVQLALDLTPGVAVADQVLRLADRDRDGQVTQQEAAAYAKDVLKDLCVRLNGKTLKLRLEDVSWPALDEIREGLGVFRIKATAAFGKLTAGRHTLKIANTHRPDISVYQVNALVPKDRTIQIAKQIRDRLQKNYRLEFVITAPPPESSASSRPAL